MKEGEDQWLCTPPLVDELEDNLLGTPLLQKFLQGSSAYEEKSWKKGLASLGKQSKGDLHGQGG